MNEQVWKIRREQRRQAKLIHGGLRTLFLATLGIKLSRMKIPARRLRTPLYRLVFGKKYPPGLDENEAEKPLSAYPSLNALFTRGIKPEFRPIPIGTPQFVSPCDGTVQDLGPVERGKILTVKNIEYSLESLLPRMDWRVFEGGQFAIIFLSPIDCHRVFCPQDGRLKEVIHVPGYRLLVHPPFQRAEFPVYTLNERMVMRFSTDVGPCAVVMVAGWGVGNIRLPLSPEFRPRSNVMAIRTFLPAAPVKRGDWLATFELGSTVVLLMPPIAGMTPRIAPNEKVKYGQPVFDFPAQ